MSKSKKVNKPVTVDQALEVGSKITNDDDTRIINKCNMELFSLPPVNTRSEQEFIQRLQDYFMIVNKYNLKPTLSGLGLAFGVARQTIYKWCNGIDSDFLSVNSRSLLKKSYAIINSSMEDYMLNGKINPVAGIFLMKNNFNYKDQSEVIQTTTTIEQTTSEQLLSKYDVIDADFKEID